jgi:hypothetical protein
VPFSIDQEENMATPNLIDFYRRNVPNPQAEPFKQDIEWVSGTTPDYTVDPQTDQAMLVTAVDIVVPRSLDLNGSDIELQGYKDGKGGTKITLSDLDDLKQKSDGVAWFDTGASPEDIKVSFKPKPPLLLTHGGGETLVIHNSQSETHTFTGPVRFAIHGYFLDESDY